MSTYSHEIMIGLNKCLQNLTEVFSSSTESIKSNVEALKIVLSTPSEERLTDICGQGMQMALAIKGELLPDTHPQNLYMCGLITLLQTISDSLPSWEDLEGITTDLTLSTFSWLEDKIVPEEFYAELHIGNFIFIPGDIGSRPNDFSNFLTVSQIDIVTKVKICAELLDDPDVNVAKNLVIYPSQNQLSNNIKSAIRILFVSINKTLHKPVISNYVPSNLSIKSWMGSDLANLDQYENLICLLSESNALDSSLDKFIKKYQVIEDLLFRRALISVMDTISPHPFSLRAWKQVAEKTEDQEQVVLQGCIREIFLSAPIGTNVIWNKTVGLWDNLVAQHTGASNIKTDIDRLLKVVIGQPTFTFTHGLFSNRSASESANLLSKGLYRFRNSIVHHKPTEFALSSETLSNGGQELLDKFWLPLLDLICYYSFTSTSPKFRYPGKTISVW